MKSTIKLRKKLITGVLESLESGVDPQKIFAVSALEGATAKLAALGPASLPEAETQPREINGPEDAVLALEDAVSIEVNRMLTQPGAINLARIKELKQSLDYIRDLKKEFSGPADTAPGGLSDEFVAEIRSKFLGD